jgi:hypothetical protein
MKPKIRLLASSGALFAMFGQALGASAADSIKFKGRTADAFFESRSGCAGTIVNVFASERVLGNPSNVGEVFLEVRQFDPCNNDEPSLAASGSAPVTPSQFKVDANLGSASLSATVTLTDTLSGSSFEVTIVDLQWTATSSRGQQNSHSIFRFLGCHINTHVNAAFRLAEAEGTISDGTTDFTPDPSLAGNLFSAKSGDRSRGC